jgi:hypothetical protein
MTAIHALGPRARTPEAHMAERWTAEIRYGPGTASSTVLFEDLVNFGALVEMDPNRDEIESIAITPNQPQRAQEIPKFLRKLA